MSDESKYLFFARSGGDREAFVRTVFEETVPVLRAIAPGALKIALTDAPNPRLTYLPLRTENLLMVSVWGEIGRGEFVQALESPGVEVFGYRVEESYPLRYERAWPDGERSPGVVLLTLLAQNPKLGREEFLSEWHGVHTPKALRIHPMWSYGRNVVSMRVPPSSPAFDGVVEEHYRDRADVLNPIRMFGGARRFLPQMLEVARHVGHFLDLGRTENYLMSEWHLEGK
ncbi:MAG: EthD domain-containing protein [Polyangiaceae bacterium]|nr:EthD domain-containing protein [Polyangiaceae bacterium]